MGTQEREEIMTGDLGKRLEVLETKLQNLGGYL